MNIRFLSFLILTFLPIMVFGQADFPYQLRLEPYEIPGMQGIHSYAYAQWGGKWIFIGGRLDGLHPRQPFRSFPASDNNTDIRVVDPNTKEIWTASVESLPVGLKEQLQSTNMQFFQEGADLFIIGGYAYSESKSDHITFPSMIIIDLEGLVGNVISEKSIESDFQQTQHDDLAVTGGYLGKIGEEFYLVGGHRFDGRYNPMGNATFTQTYTNAIRKFALTKENGQWSLGDVTEIYDPVHLHRRDYNLLPQVFPDGTPGYTLFSGVFQINEDLPFLYPVDITAEDYQPRTGFSQYLSNYHSANVALYDSESQAMHNVFFGGISQYYYEENELQKDNNVPFVKTISRVSRDQNGLLEEVRLPLDMPDYLGASAEFLMNEDLPMAGVDIVDLAGITADSFLLGYIVGGIQSNVANAFAFNNTEATAASPTIFKVFLKKTDLSTSVATALPGYHSFEMKTYPNPNHSNVFKVEAQLPEKGLVEVFATDASGRLVMNHRKFGLLKGDNSFEVNLKRPVSGVVYITAILNGRYAATSQIVFD
jgi:hypothetical protein